MRRPKRALLLGLAVLGLALTSGCATAFDGHTYQGDGYSFQVATTPPAWRPIEATGAALAYRDPASGAQMLVNARCDRDGEDVPLRSLTQHLFIRFTEREIHSEEVRPFDGREALRTDITAKLDGVPQRFLVWVLKKDKCVYDLLYFSHPDRFDPGAAQFEQWAQSFTALPRAALP